MNGEEYTKSEIEFENLICLAKKFYNEEPVQETLSIDEFTKEMTGMTYGELEEETGLKVNYTATKSHKVGDTEFVDEGCIDSAILDGSDLFYNNTGKEIKDCEVIANKPIYYDPAIIACTRLKPENAPQMFYDGEDIEGSFQWAYSKAKDDYVIRRKCWEYGGYIYIGNNPFFLTTETNENYKFLRADIEADDWELFEDKSEKPETNTEWLNRLGMDGWKWAEEEYGNAGSARTGANEEINNIISSGLPSGKFIPIATVIFKTNGEYVNCVDDFTATDWEVKK